MNATAKWSPYQQAIFNMVSDPNGGNGLVEAVAGSGKTTTLVEAMRLAQGQCIFLAFNKSIAEELKSRGCNARTFHSLTYMPVTRAVGARTVEADKLRQICKANLTGDEMRIYGSFIIRLVGLARQVGIDCLVPNMPSSWNDIIEHHSLELESEEAEYCRAVELATDLLRWSNASKMVDFDDLLYLAVKKGVVLPKFDFVFVDEAQDTNAIQRAILRKIMKPNTRIVAVGDPAQAIYGFRGADSDSMDLLATEFKCKRFPLSISYRCAQSVVKFAQQWVPGIRYSETAPEGVVRSIGTNWDHTVFNARDLVVCRKTAPLLHLAFKLLSARVSVQVMGREIGAGLKALIEKMGSRTVDHLLTKLDTYRTRETEKAIAQGSEAKAEQIGDKVDSITCLINGLSENSRTVSELNRVIDTLFADKSNAVTLATIHKAKGLEADNVFWLESTNAACRWIRLPWQVKQEDNLCYVAATRAKKSLTMIDFKGREE
jgi:superfamily I DNA/RNA helicase